MPWRLFGCFTLLWTLTLTSCAAPSSSPVVESEPTNAEATQATEPTAVRTPTPPAVRTERDIEFVPGGGALQSLDVYLPQEGEGPFPIILGIHGGGFRARSKSLYNFIAEDLAREGYAFVSTNYRLNHNASYPAQVEDVFCALAWVHSNHEAYGFDPENVFVWGGSAGAYLAGMVGTVETPDIYLNNCPSTVPADDWLKGMILFYGFYDFTDPESIAGFPRGDLNASLEPYWGANYEELSQKILAEMSPISWVDGSEPPALLLHGTEDTSVPSWMSQQFAAALADAGVGVELMLFDAGHAFELRLNSPEMVQSLEAVKSFLETNSTDG
jgi:acetyl esterase/lipase